MAEARRDRPTEILAPHFSNLEQQHEANTFGMWVFLLTELLLFGGLFTAYILYRYVYQAGFAEGSSHLEAALGAINTAVLITSSLTMALAVRFAQTGRRKILALFLVLTLAFGLAFLGIKGVEYYHHYVDQNVPGIHWNLSSPNGNAVQLFFILYFVMTGLHAVHLIIGTVLVVILLVLTSLGRITQVNWTPAELVGLYWHFVDIVWIFLFPLLYLIKPL